MPVSGRIASRIRAILPFALLLAPCVSAQTATPQPPATPPTPEEIRNTLPPSTIYDQTMRPLDATRADIANWSETETAALSVAMKTAHAECTRLEQTPREGEELYFLARLCSLGQDWPGAYSAATTYLRDDKAPHLPQGYYLLVQANFNMQKIANVLDALKEMNDRLPFTADTDAVFNYAIAAIEISRPSDGINAALLRQPRLLDAINSKNQTVSPGIAEAEAWHTLELLRFADRNTWEIAGALNDLQQAIAARTVALSATDAYIAAVAHRQYDALGKPMPTFTIARNTELRSYSPKPADVNLFVLYPEDCAACTPIPDTVDELRKGFNVRAHAWTLVESDPNDKSIQPAKLIVHSPAKSSIAKDAPHVPPALYTTTPLMQQLGMEGVLSYIVTDIHGNIRFLSTGPTGWLRPDGNQDILIQVVMERILNHDDDERISKDEKSLGIMKGNPIPQTAH